MRRDEASWKLTADLYEAGYSLAEVAARVHVTVPGVRARLQKLGIQLRPPGPASGSNRLAQQEFQLTADLYVKRGMSTIMIAEILDITPQTVAYRLRKAGVTRSRSEQSRLMHARKRA